MEFKGIKNLSKFVEIVKKSEFEETSEDKIFDQFLNNAKIEKIDPKPRIENSGLGYYDYGSESGFDAGSNYLILEGNGVISTVIDTHTLYSAIEKFTFSENSINIEDVVEKFFLSAE